MMVKHLLIEQLIPPPFQMHHYAQVNRPNLPHRSISVMLDFIFFFTILRAVVCVFWTGANSIPALSRLWFWLLVLWFCRLAGTYDTNK
jgi:hypothetical protein